MRSIVCSSAIHCTPRGLMISKAGNYRTTYLYPNYDEWDSSAPEIEPIELVLITGTKRKMITMPVLYKGSGEVFRIDNKLNITE